MEGFGHTSTTEPHPHPLDQVIWFMSVVILVENVLDG